jgi:two-component system CheB/CheR fusion protein
MFSDAAGVRRLRILVADPCRDTVDSFCVLLSLWGHRARYALDGPGTLDAARSFAPDVVLMELALPRLDGYAVARRLARMLAPQVPLLVAITGYGAKVDRHRTHAAGFRYHLLKPVAPELLRTMLIATDLRQVAPLPEKTQRPAPAAAGLLR